MCIEGSNGSECVLSAEDFRELARSGHPGPVYFCFIPGEKVCIYVPEPFLQLASLWVIIWDGRKAVNIPVGKAVDAVRLWTDTITIRLFREDGIGWERAGSLGKWEWGLEIAKMVAALALAGTSATVDSPSGRRFSAVVGAVVNCSVK